MKKLLLAITLLGGLASACIPPIKPLPPLGCTYQDAVLVHSPNGNICYWVYMNCGN